VAGLAGGVIRETEADAEAAIMPPAKGAVHSADIEYAMGNLSTNLVYAWTEEDEQVSELMQGYYANFCKTGDPNGPGLPVWPRADKGPEVQYMVWDVEPEVRVDRHRQRYVFHDQVHKLNTNQALTLKQQSIIPIAAFTANGDLDKLRTALFDGLGAGLTMNEIKEILVHLYAYTGFPRSLNGINTFMAVVDERRAQGIEDEIGPEASPLPADMNKDEYGAKVRAKLAGWDKIPPPGGYQLFAPIMDTFLKEHLFADIFARDILDFQSRELVTISALASMTGTAGQLWFHLGAAMNTGLTEAQMKDFISVLECRVGKKEAESAYEILSKVLGKRTHP
jgi:alkylhydroperoxidase/carboxymuconolactone decarboxylase family protein YurZ